MSKGNFAQRSHLNVQDAKSINEKRTVVKPFKEREDHAIRMNKLRPYLAIAARVSGRRREMEIERKSALGTYFDVKDQKSVPSNTLYDRETKLLDDEMRAVRATARSLLGDRPISIRLYQTYDQVCDSSGVLSSATTIDPSPLTEFTSLAALFDEYKVTECDYEFQWQNYTALAAGVAVSHGAAIGYDPAEAAVTTSLVTTAQLGQSRYLMLPATAVAINAPVRTQTHLEVFRARVPPGVLLSNNTGGPSATSSWQACNLGSGAYIPYGYLKVYATRFNVVSAPAVSGMLTYHCQFRCRS